MSAIEKAAFFGQSRLTCELHGLFVKNERLCSVQRDSAPVDLTITDLA